MNNPTLHRTRHERLLVALRRHLPGVRAELRRRRRRRNGDIAGLRSRLQYLADLGVDAIWITPGTRPRWPTAATTSPTSAASTPHTAPSTRPEADQRGPRVGLRVILDIVPNHASDQHAWFQGRCAAAPGSPERDRFIFREGGGGRQRARPTTGTRLSAAPPGPAREDGQWYLHLFAPEQPDLPSSRGGSHPSALTEPCVTVARYTALVVLVVRPIRRPWSGASARTCGGIAGRSPASSRWPSAGPRAVCTSGGSSAPGRR